MAGLELVQGGGVLNLRTGELLSLKEASLDDLAEAREALADLWHERTTAAMMIDAELVERADAALAVGEEFGRTGRFQVSVDRGGAVAYDSVGLRAELMARARRGDLPITSLAVEHAFRVTQYRLDRSRWANLTKRWPELAEIAERFTQPIRRKAKVERRAVDSTAEVFACTQGEIES